MDSNMDNLPDRETFLSTQVQTVEQPPADEADCPICFLPWIEADDEDSSSESPIVALNCDGLQHTFHRECLMHWLKGDDAKGGTNLCPRCRRPLFRDVERAADREELTYWDLEEEEFASRINDLIEAAWVDEHYVNFIAVANEENLTIGQCDEALRELLRLQSELIQNSIAQVYRCEIGPHMSSFIVLSQVLYWKSDQVPQAVINRILAHRVEACQCALDYGRQCFLDHEEADRGAWHMYMDIFDAFRDYSRELRLRNQVDMGSPPISVEWRLTLGPHQPVVVKQPELTMNPAQTQSAFSEDPGRLLNGYSKYFSHDRMLVDESRTDPEFLLGAGFQHLDGDWDQWYDTITDPLDPSQEYLIDLQNTSKDCAHRECQIGEHCCSESDSETSTTVLLCERDCGGISFRDKNDFCLFDCQRFETEDTLKLVYTVRHNRNLTLWVKFDPSNETRGHQSDCCEKKILASGIRGDIGGSCPSQPEVTSECESAKAEEQATVHWMNFLVRYGNFRAERT